MGTQVKRFGRVARIATALILAVGLTALAYVASAASLGGINASHVYSTSMMVTVVVDAPIASDTFEGCHSHLDGWVDSVGNVWTSHEGNWICVANSVARNEKRVSIAHASVETGLSDGISVSTDIVRVSTQKNRSGPGLALFDDGTYFISVLYKREQGRLVLGVMGPSGYRELAEVDPISDFDTVTLTAQIQQPNLTVLLNGSQVLTYDLSDLAPHELFLLTNTRHGLASDNDNWSHFGTFTVEVLP